MKVQDIIFLIIMIILIGKKDPRWFAIAGLTCITLAIPLFAWWIFFTAERLTWYASAYFFTFILMTMREDRR